MAERSAEDLLRSMLKRIDLLERRQFNRKTSGSGSTVPVFLTNSDNLNDIRTAGIYEVRGNSIASASRNYPMERSGFLEVYAHPDNNGRVMQRYNAESALNDLVFSRYWLSGNWGEWLVEGDHLTVLNNGARDAIHSPYKNLRVYVTGSSTEYIYTGSTWIEAGTYMPGEKYMFNAGGDQVTYPGIVTGGNKTIHVSIILPKKIRSGGSFTIQHLWINVRGGTGGYWSVGGFLSGGYSTAANGITRGVYGAYENIAVIRLTRSTDFFSTNNMPVSVEVSRIELTFT